MDVSLSLKYVGRLLAGALELGFSKGDSDGSTWMVARHREDSEKGCGNVLLTLRNGGAFRHRNRLPVAAIVRPTYLDWTGVGKVEIGWSIGNKVNEWKSIAADFRLSRDQLSF